MGEPATETSAGDLLTIDWLSWVLVGLVFVVQAGALVAVSRADTWLALPDQQTNVTISAWVIGILVAESLALVALWRCWKWLPEWVRTAVRYIVKASVVAFVGYLFVAIGSVAFAAVIIGCFAISYAVVEVLDRYELLWIAFDGIGLLLGIALTALAGHYVAPVVVVPLLVLTIVWDHIAVNLSDIMGDLVDFSVSAGLFNFLVIPNRLQIDLEAVQSYIKDTEANARPSALAALIGLGDFVLPGMLTVSAWVVGVATPAVATLAGTALAMVVLRDSMSRTDGALPALPWLNTGAIVGFAAGIAVSGVPVLTALGVQ